MSIDEARVRLVGLAMHIARVGFLSDETLADLRATTAKYDAAAAAEIAETDALLAELAARRSA